MRSLLERMRSEQGAALMEFAICLPLLVVFIVGIYDFSGAFNRKQQIEHAVHVGAVVAGAQPMSDIYTTNGNPSSLQPVLETIVSDLASGKVVDPATCLSSSATVTPPAVGEVKWIYTINGCPDRLTIEINRGWVPLGVNPPVPVGTSVTVTYPYQWKFNSVIQLLIPGATYAAITNLTESATVHNQN